MVEKWNYDFFHCEIKRIIKKLLKDIYKKKKNKCKISISLKEIEYSKDRMLFFFFYFLFFDTYAIYWRCFVVVEFDGTRSVEFYIELST